MELSPDSLEVGVEESGQESSPPKTFSRKEGNDIRGIPSLDESEERLSVLALAWESHPPIKDLKVLVMTSRKQRGNRSTYIKERAFTDAAATGLDTKKAVDRVKASMPSRDDPVTRKQKERRGVERTRKRLTMTLLPKGPILSVSRLFSGVNLLPNLFRAGISAFNPQAKLIRPS
ncbi:hypothetical protein VNO77_46947 [Canavalia gladiata]|uniref:Uncharacterized protein n=1 Tax=Canavalia gladiata TaxID=3824 RepID=A0AAN9JI16_CANGL